MQQEVRSRTPGRSWSRSQLVLGVSGRPAGGSWEGRGWVRLLLSWWLWLREGQTNSSGVQETSLGEERPVIQVRENKAYTTVAEGKR